MEDIKLDKAILHILDTNHGAPVLSAQELDIDKDVSDFLTKHIAKVQNDGDIKKAWFNPDGSAVYDLCTRLCQDEAMFTEVSIELAQRLFSIMRQHPLIPSGDVIFCLFAAAGARYFGLLKLNYRSSYIHYVANADAGSINSLIKQKTTLPGEAQKADECVFVNLGDLGLSLLEKQYEICDKKEYYLAKYFLKCRSELSCAQKLQILDKTVGKISRKHLDKDFDKVTKLRSCLAESMEETNEIKVDQVAERVFGGNTACKEEVMEFINNPDGTISILIKNVNKVANK